MALPRPSYPSLPNPSDPRLFEARAFAELARRLAKARATGSNQSLREAVLTNWKLWNIIGDEAEREASPFPPGIKDRLLTLSHFVATESAELIVNPDMERAAVLVDLNHSLAIGQHRSAVPVPTNFVRPLRLLRFTA